MTCIEHGEGITCIRCSAWRTRGDNYVCSRCKLDNVKQAKTELRKYTDAPAGGKRPGLEYEGFKK